MPVLFNQTVAHGANFYRVEIDNAKCLEVINTANIVRRGELVAKIAKLVEPLGLRKLKIHNYYLFNTHNLLFSIRKHNYWYSIKDQ